MRLSVGVLTLLLISSLYSPIASAFSGAGSGTVGDPYVITDVMQLQEMQDDLAAHYILGNDIDATSTSLWNDASTSTDTLEGFDPVGDDTNAFLGSLDGDGFAISNLYINRPEEFYIGLFGYADEGSSITNLSLVDCDISGAVYVGTLAGRARMTMTNCDAIGVIHNDDMMLVGGLIGSLYYGSISQCHADVDINAASYCETIGGLAGLNNHSTLSECTSTGDINGVCFTVGGLVGENSYGLIYRCHTTSQFNLTEEPNIIGGLAGYNIGSSGEFSEEGAIIECSAENSVHGYNHTGGLVGIMDRGLITKCRVNTDAAGNLYVGGIVGKAEDGAIIQCHVTGTISGGSFIGGVAGFYGDCEIKQCYVEGIISGDNPCGLSDWGFGPVSQCYVAAELDASIEAFALVCKNGDGPFQDSFWDATLNPGISATGDFGTDPVNCYGVSEAELMRKTTFEGTGGYALTEAWDFASNDGVWWIIEDETMPFFQWEYLGSRLTWALSDGETTGAAEQTVVVEWSDPVTSFTIPDDLTLINCTAGGLMDYGTSASFNVTASSEGAFSVRVTSGCVTNAEGRLNLNSNLLVANYMEPPAAPADLSATATSQTLIQLTWTDNADDESGFELERSLNGVDSWTLITSPTANVEAYDDAPLSPATTYHYRVRAVNAGCASAWSNIAAAATLPNPPAAPTELTAIASSQTRIELTWTDNADNETTYTLERSPNGEDDWTVAAELPENTSACADDELTTATPYFYRLRAENTGGVSAWSNIAEATTLPDLPLAPTDISIAMTSQTQIAISWRDRSYNETGFIVYSGPGAQAPATPTTTTLADAGQFTTTGLAINAQYAFQVAATNAAGDSAKTENVTTWTLAAMPAVLEAGNPTTDSLELAVGADDGNPTHTLYAMYCETTKQWLAASGTLESAAAYQTRADWGDITVRGLTKGTTYTFHAVAQNGARIDTLPGPSVSLATLLPVYILTVIAENGVVVRDPDAGSYIEGTTVTLTAEAAASHAFTGWSGDVPSGDETDNPLSIVMDNDKTLTANFLEIVPVTDEQLRDYLLGIISLTPGQCLGADRNQDGYIDIGDLLAQ
ncbi:fibronectin type III domain-containing protein [Candidatus Sumerlaeota bacterium]|nr:fibronectin type III domain-containing protein [Candidatus Sumerlaeota bacterium]